MFFNLKRWPDWLRLGVFFAGFSMLLIGLMYSGEYIDGGFILFFITIISHLLISTPLDFLFTELLQIPHEYIHIVDEDSGAFLSGMFEPLTFLGSILSILFWFFVGCVAGSLFELVEHLVKNKK